jgi:hypothetical protein
MLDLFVAADAVRQKTTEPLREDAPKGKAGKRIRRRRSAVRSISATALRGLADLLEPSRTGTVSG